MVNKRLDPGGCLASDRRLENAVTYEHRKSFFAVFFFSNGVVKTIDWLLVSQIHFLF